MLFWLLSTLLMTYRPLSTQRSLGHSASTRRPEPPGWRCVARAVPDPHEPKHFARSRRDILVGAAAGMFPCVGIVAGAVQKFPESKYLELRPEPPELGHFQEFGNGPLGH